jgi:hypothetical protein
MPQQPSNAGARWFPTVEQLKDPAATERVFRQVLTQLYTLTDRLNAMGSAPAKPAAAAPSNGPTDSMLVGLHVAPVDTSTLADGATLQYDKAAGNLKFV